MVLAQLSNAIDSGFEISGPFFRSHSRDATRADGASKSVVFLFVFFVKDQARDITPRFRETLSVNDGQRSHIKLRPSTSRVPALVVWRLGMRGATYKFLMSFKTTSKT